MERFRSSTANCTSCSLRKKEIIEQKIKRGAIDGYDKLDDLAIEIIRRDDTGEEDFTVPMSIVADRKLPDPRAKLVKVDLEEPLVEALFTVGVALRSPHRVTLNGIAATAEFDGEKFEFVSLFE